MSWLHMFYKRKLTTILEEDLYEAEIQLKQWTASAENATSHAAMLGKRVARLKKQLDAARAKEK